jgi:hypothetical protein
VSRVEQRKRTVEEEEEEEEASERRSLEAEKGKVCKG